MLCVQEIDEADDVWSVKRFSERSFDDEFGSTIESDLILLQVRNPCFTSCFDCNVHYLAVLVPRSLLS